jgi:glucokinase
MPAKRRPTTAPLPRLVADIGGTNARFALSREEGITDEKVLACAEYPSLEAAAEFYLSGLAAAGRALRPQEAALDIAGPLLGDRVALTNHPWSFSAAAVRRALGMKRLILLNDFTALALAIPQLSPAALEQVGGDRADPKAAIGLLGPGTGLGVSGLVPGAGLWLPLQGEGGHVTLPATTAREREVLGWLQNRFPHVSAERVLSGSGIALLYEALCQIDGRPSESLAADQVTQRGLTEVAGTCRSALDMFCGWLGMVAGDLALTLGAHGGMYIGGGIVPRFGPFFARSPFRERFEAKGRFASYLASIPVFVITARNPALLGCARAFSNPSPRVEAD